MSIKTIQKRIQNLIVLGILSTGAVLAGTGCDLDNPATKGMLDSARIGSELASVDAPSTSAAGYLEMKLANVYVVSYE